MERDKACKKCSQCFDFNIDAYTVCEGDCAGFFHAKCVGLSVEDLSVLSSNIIWMCNTCMHKFRRMRDSISAEPTREESNVKSIDDEVKQLKATVAEILETLSKIVPAASSSEAPLLHSTPISSCQLLNQTEASGPNRESDERLRTTNDGDFSLFLSNIDECATERDVQKMVLQALGTHEPENVDIVKLTSKWNHRRKLDYISFKVVLNKRWKPRAMNPCVWPKNVKFREFRQSETWKPA